MTQITSEKELNFLLSVAEKVHRGRKVEVHLDAVKKIVNGNVSSIPSVDRVSPRMTLRNLSALADKLKAWPTDSDAKVEKAASNLTAYNVKVAAKGYLNGEFKNTSQAARLSGCNTASVNLLIKRIKTLDQFAADYKELLE